MIQPRPAQEKILAYKTGKMGIAAVPGSGKTWILSLLAANLISEGYIGMEQEVLVVTLVNAAVENFSVRINHFIGERGLMPRVGYRVRTLHSLAHDIVRERPGLVGLADDFDILDERATVKILTEVSRLWLHSHPEFVSAYMAPDVPKPDWIANAKFPKLVEDIAQAFIRTAKDRQLTPQELRARLDELPLPLPLAEMGCEIYTDYQRALAYHNAVDFDDLIRLALRALQSDPDYLARLRTRWPYILEDEAQDSSRLQEQILRMLAGQPGNWVRVGDPNQAIYETFTTASPEHLRNFLHEPYVIARDLPDSGRSMASIIAIANRLIEWTQHAHPVPEVRNALTPPFIRPTPPDDPQPNPSDTPAEIHLVQKKFSPDQELKAVADSLERGLKQHPDWTVAALVSTNSRATSLLKELSRRQIPYVDDLLNSTSITRSTAGALQYVLDALVSPTKSKSLAKIYTVWQRDARQDAAAWQKVNLQADFLNRCTHPETFIWPLPGEDYLEAWPQDDPQGRAALESFRQVLRRWHQAVHLPIDQLLLTVAQDLFRTPAELALTHKLAAMLRQARDLNPTWRLQDLNNELTIIAKNERRFLGISQENVGFNPEAHKGKVVVATIHKAKGLEWDRVYLMSVNNYDFPSAQPEDTYMSEPWFVQGKLNLPAEALEQLRLTLENGEDWYEPGRATQAARLEYVRERLRLLYVGITRARRSLIITWNTGQKGAQPAIPFLALAQWWQRQAESAS
ncbi:MAG: ATP-dependent helicase [Anaerolineales bacterium]